MDYMRLNLEQETLPSRIQHIAVPFFLNRDARTQTRSLVITVILLLGFGLGISGVLLVLLDEANWAASVVYFGLLALLVPLYWLARLGLTFHSRVLLIAGIWAATTVLSMSTGGLYSPVRTLYAFVIVLAGILIGPGGAILTAALNALTLIILYQVSLHGVYQIPVPDADALLQVSITISIYLLVAVLLYVASRILTIMYHREHLVAAELERTLGDLQSSTVSREYVDNIIQSMRSMLIALNPEGRITTVNHSLLQSLGYEEDELIGQHFNATILGEINRKHDSGVFSATMLLSQQMTQNVSQTFLAKDGRLIPVSVSSAMMRAPNGVILGVVVVAHDETERRHTEQQLRFQAELLQSISDAVVATDLTMKIVSWNRAAERVYGYEASEVIGRDLREVVKQASSNEARAIDPADTASNWRPEQVHYRKDGTMLQILSSISLMRDVYDQPTGLVIVNHDITALKHTESELERRLEQLALLRHIDAELGHTLDIEKVLNFSLRAAVALAGADSGFIALIDERGDPQIEVYGNAVNSVTARNIEQHSVVTHLMTSLEALYYTDDTELEAIRESFQPGTKAVIALPLLNQQRFIGLVELETEKEENFTRDVFDFLSILVQRIATSVDNARLYRLSQNHLAELQSLYGHVSKLEQIKTDMIRIASHDLRSPIGLISGYLSLLETDLADRIQPLEAEFLAEAMKATNRMEQITRDLLSLERISQVADANFEETVDLIEIVERAVETYRRQAAHGRQKLVYAVDTALDQAIVNGDPAQLYEAMSNLLSNALKYTPEGGEITVMLRRSDDNAVFMVTDTGYGIPESEYDKLFLPFSRAASAETAAVRGTGLGLHLVKNIVDRHDGRVIFRSEYRKGSTFGFELPLVEQTTAEVPS